MNRKFIENSNYVLRKVLHSNNCLDILKNFIESFLKIEVKNIKINKNPQLKKFKNREYGIIDTRITTKEDEELNVGIQIIDGDYIQNKMFLYYAKIHSNQILYGDNRKIAKTVTINILDMPYFSSIQYHRIIKIKTNIISDSILETMELHVVELPKYTRELKTENINKGEWVTYLKGEDNDSICKIKSKNKYIKKLDDLLEKYWEDEII